MKKTEFYTEHRGYRFPNCTTLEKIGMEMSNCCDALMRMGDKVIFAPMTYAGGNTAAIYEFIETPEETGLGDHRDFRRRIRGCRSCGSLGICKNLNNNYLRRRTPMGSFFRGRK